MSRPYRVLSIDPCCKGLGYAIVELPCTLLDFGRVWNSEGRKNTFTRFRGFLSRTRPDTLILENTSALGSRRRPRIVRLLQAIEREAGKRGMRVQKISRLQTLDRFKDALPRTTKYTVACELARRHPILLPFLPPLRKPWQSEDERLAIFDALAFGAARLKARGPGTE